MQAKTFSHGLINYKDTKTKLRIYTIQTVCCWEGVGGVELC